MWQAGNLYSSNCLKSSQFDLSEPFPQRTALSCSFTEQQSQTVHLKKQNRKKRKKLILKNQTPEVGIKQQIWSVSLKNQNLLFI